MACLKTLVYTVNLFPGRKSVSPTPRFLLTMTQGKYSHDTVPRDLFHYSISKSILLRRVLKSPSIAILRSRLAHTIVSKMPSIGGRPQPLKSPPPITVDNSAEDFLRALPNVKRGELTAEDQKYSICLEPFSTTPSDRGVIERPKRLPCGHVLGSEVS